MATMYDENWALEEATKIACMSPCKSKRGVIIWCRVKGIMSIGYNAPPLPFVCTGDEACRAKCSKTALHAEQAALMRFAKRHTYDVEMLHVKVVDGKAVTSEKPSCWQCSKLILASEVQYMWLYQKEGLVRYTALDFHEKTLENCDLK